MAARSMGKVKKQVRCLGHKCHFKIGQCSYFLLYHANQVRGKMFHRVSFSPPLGRRRQRQDGRRVRP